VKKRNLNSWHFVCTIDFVSDVFELALCEVLLVLLFNNQFEPPIPSYSIDSYAQNHVVTVTYCLFGTNVGRLLFATKSRSSTPNSQDAAARSLVDNSKVEQSAF
jgi:K+-sensing histidine kinase KdpD